MRRRDFIKHLIKATGGAAVATTPLTTLAAPESQPEITQEQALAVLGYEPVFPDGVPQPYPDAERTAIIDRWIEIVDETTVKLETLWTYLHDARSMSPDETDGTQSFKLMTAAHDAMNDLCSAIECGGKDLNPDKFLVALSNEPICFICVRDEILHDDIKEPYRLKLEIDAIREDYPEYGAELQRLFDARFGKAGC